MLEFIVVVKVLTEVLSGYWGTFPSEQAAIKFMESYDMPRDSYNIILLNKPRKRG